jgi:hypothetical protein
VLGLFNFRTPGRDESAAIRFVDENGDYALLELLDALWLRVAVPHPGTDWLDWYRLLERFVGYARLDAVTGPAVDVTCWPTDPAASYARSHIFVDEVGRVPLISLVDTVSTLGPAKPVLAKHLARLMIRIAEIDRRRDEAARRLLERAGLLVDA